MVTHVSVVFNTTSVEFRVPPMGLKTYKAMSMKTNALMAQKQITHVQYAITTLVTIDMQSKARTWF